MRGLSSLISDGATEFNILPYFPRRRYHIPCDAWVIMLYFSYKRYCFDEKHCIPMVSNNVSEKQNASSYYEPQSFKTEIWFLQFIKDRFGNGHVGWFFDDYEKMHQPASARNLKGYSHAWPLWFITNSFHIHQKLHEKGKFTIVNKLLQNNCYKTWNRKYLALVAQMNLAWIRRLGVQVTPWVLPPKHPFMLVEHTNG